jgi:hypothetical protein
VLQSGRYHVDPVYIVGVGSLWEEKVDCLRIDDYVHW